jgi:hypothetical protein
MICFRRFVLIPVACLLLAFCTAMVLIAVPAGPASAQSQAWTFAPGDPLGNGADRFAYAAFPWQSGYSARVHFDPEAGEWVFFLLYPGQDDAPRPRSIAAHYLADASQGRTDERWEQLDYASGDYDTFIVEDGRSTVVAFVVPASFVAHLKRADSVIVDAGQDAIRVPLTGSARAIAEIEAVAVPVPANNADTLSEILSNSETRRRGEEEQPGDVLDAPEVSARSDATPPDADAFYELADELCDYEILEAEDFISAGFAPPEDVDDFCNDLMWGGPPLKPLAAGTDQMPPSPAPAAGLPQVPDWQRFTCDIFSIPDYIACLNADNATVEAQTLTFVAALADHAGLSPEDPEFLERLDPMSAARALEFQTSFVGRTRDRQAVAERQLDRWFTLPEQTVCYSPALVPGGTIPDMDFFNLGYTNYVDCLQSDAADALALTQQRLDEMKAADNLPMPDGFDPNFATLIRSRKDAMVRAYNERDSRSFEELQAWKDEASRIYGVSFR